MSLRNMRLHLKKCSGEKCTDTLNQNNCTNTLSQDNCTNTLSQNNFTNTFAQDKYIELSIRRFIELLMRSFIRLMTLWLWGGFVYYCIELLYRGYSHPSMFIVGGVAFLLVGGINNYLPWKLGFVWQCVIGGIVITVLELIAGLIVNVWLGLGVWDYSHMPMNVMGQIVPHYTLAWMGLSVVAILLDDFLRWKLYGEERPHYTLL